MYVGVLVKKYKMLDCPVKTAYIGVVGVIVSLNSSMGMNENNYDNFPLCIIAAITISFSLLILFKKIKYLENPMLIYMGKNSLLIVGFNYLLRDVATEMYYLIPGLRNYDMMWIPLFILTLLFSIMFIYLVDKMKELFARAIGLFSKQSVASKRYY